MAPDFRPLVGILKRVIRPYEMIIPSETKFPFIRML